MKTGDAEWLKQQVEAYRGEQPHYKDYAEKLLEILERARDRIAPEATVKARAKSLSGFAEKAMRKKDKYADPIHQLTDLAGARVMVLTEEEAEEFCGFIREHFLVDQANSEDCSKRLAAREFGYRGLHFVVQMDRKRGPVLGVAMPDDLGGRKAEIQIQTLLQSAWAAIGHDRMYKSPFTVPQPLERAGARVAALLEASDKEFARLVDDLDRFAMNHGVAKDSEHLLRELVDLSVLRSTDTSSTARAGYALRQAQLARILRAWPLVVAFLEGVSLEGVPEHLANCVRLELGQAYCRTSSPKGPVHVVGQELLAKVARPGKPPDCRGGVPRHERELRARAAAALAQSTEGGSAAGPYDPVALFRLAMQCDPASPYHLASFLDYEIARHKQTEYAELMRPGLLAAIETCQNHAAVRIELPRAFLVAGEFLLTLGQTLDALGEYAKAVNVCLDPANCISISALDEELHRQERLREGLPAGAVWVERLLTMARAIKADPSHPCADCVAKFAALAGKPDGALPDWIKELREVMQSLKATSGEPWVSWPRLLNETATCVHVTARPTAEALRPLASKTPPTIKPPVLIVAGGADPHIEYRMREYRDHLLQALMDFKGTICSGATEQGIPGLVGDVVREVRERGNRDQRLIGYLPQELPGDATEDIRYDQRVRTEGTGFTPMEPLQNWTDLLAAGVKPTEVRLLGINGGPIAATEYRLALALGASVGVVESSGRAVAELLPDVHWWQARNLLVLPADRMAVRAFVMAGQVPSVLEGEQLEELARKVHDNFLKARRYKRGDPTVMPYEFLTDPLQDSSRQQVLYWVQLLHATGYGVRPATRADDPPRKFTPDEEQFMAEMEHGRWIVERLRDGWRYGPTRDHAKKLSPYLVAWRDVPDKVKEWDLETVRSLPSVLADSGLEVFRPAPSH